MQAKPLTAAAVIGAVWVTGAWAMPVVQDEAYYFAWAEHLDLGYFDHPPLVALMGVTARLAGGSPLVARIGALLVAALTVAAAARFFRAVGLGGPRALTAALLLAFGNLLGLICGFLATPDAVLMLAWALALGEAAAALEGAPRRWVTAGLATGLGLLAKYTMLLMGPVFLWALIAEARRAPSGTRVGLSSPWPYLGGLACLLVLLPHLWWNAEHDWITPRFQLRHGLAQEHLALGTPSSLPPPETPALGSDEVRLASAFAKTLEEETKAERAPRFYDGALKALNRYAGYYASQLGLWGGLGVALLVAVRRERRERRERGGLGGPPANADDTAVSLATRPLVIAATAVPLLVFGAVSLVSQVEANWSAMYVIGAAALLAPLAVRCPRLVTYGTLANVALVAIGLAHAATGFLPVRPHRDRVLSETHGYRELAHLLATLDGPVFADSYQLTAMTRFLSPGLEVRQWPGITRDSEFVRRPEFASLSGAALTAHGRFWLVTTAALPPHFAGFSPAQMAQVRDCKATELQVISTQAAANSERRCNKPIHEWFLVRYVASPRSG